MTKIKRKQSGKFAKGSKGGPGRPKKGELGEFTSTEARKQFFKWFFKYMTEAKFKDLMSSKKWQMQFLQEIRRMMPVSIEQDVKTDFKPLEIQVVHVEGSEHESARIKELEEQLTKQQRFIEAYEKTLREHGLVPTIKHDPIEPLRLAEGQDGTFKSDAEKKLQDEDEDDCNPDNLPKADVVYSRK